jgi:hypothetical protein
MRLLAVHPSALMYTRVYLRLEPLGLELVASAARRAGHDVRLIDLQVERHEDYFAMLESWQPDAVCFSGSSPRAHGEGGWRLRGELGQPTQVLGDGRQRELVLCASRPAQTQTAELQDAFQMGERHLDALAVAA